MSDLIKNPKDRLSHNEAQLIEAFNVCSCFLNTYRNQIKNNKEHIETQLSLFYKSIGVFYMLKSTYNSYAVGWLVG